MTQVKFFNGRRLVGTITTDSPSRVINYWQTHTDVPNWTRYKIVDSAHKSARRTQHTTKEARQ